MQNKQKALLVFLPVHWN